MRYVFARITHTEREETYRIFVTDGLNALLGGKNMRYADLLKPKDNRTAEDIISNIKEKIGG